MKVIADSERLLQNTLEGREDEVAAALDHAHTEIASNLDYAGTPIKLSDAGGI